MWRHWLRGNFHFLLRSHNYYINLALYFNGLVIKVAAFSINFCSSFFDHALKLMSHKRNDIAAVGGPVDREFSLYFEDFGPQEWSQT